MKLSTLAASYYGRMLRLYPVRFRERYDEQIWQSTIDCRADCRHASIFWTRIFLDLFWSIVREQMRVASESINSRPVMYYTAALAVGLTMMGGAAAMTMQQMLRRGADQPQSEMVAAASNQLMASPAEANLLFEGIRARKSVNIAESLEPFLIFYDSDGRPRAASGLLGSSIPIPPAGVIDYVRQHGAETLTWAPRRDVRIATVLWRVGGSTPGFILAGRSLPDVETYESLLRTMVFVGWFVVMGLLSAGAFFLQRSRLRTNQ